MKDMAIHHMVSRILIMQIFCLFFIVKRRQQLPVQPITKIIHVTHVHCIQIRKHIAKKIKKIWYQGSLKRIQTPVIEFERDNRLVSRDRCGKPFDDALLKTLDINFYKIDFSNLMLTDEVITPGDGDFFST